ncbi:MAG TPA: hypothetical protein PKA77_15725 [Chitinophagaceae bacterium]|jgi:hypothetical protein|nr:hypothetical protein [Chitinophagaceae bacterium]HMU59646.1 hypothetical protein [Chitinophagaceae bacterium]
MNRLLFFLLAILFATNSKGNELNLSCRPTDTLLSYLEQVDIEYFKDKPIDSLLASIPGTPVELKVFSTPSNRTWIFLASYIQIKYSNGSMIFAYVKQFYHMNPYSASFSWDVNLFRKEKAYRIDVYKDSFNCINGDCLE